MLVKIYKVVSGEGPTKRLYRHDIMACEFSWFSFYITMSISVSASLVDVEWRQLKHANANQLKIEVTKSSSVFLPASFIPQCT